MSEDKPVRPVEIKRGTFKWSDLKVWQKAHSLTLAVYDRTSDFPQSGKYALTSQIRRASVSVPSNIVEGFKRKSIRESLNFYNIAVGSLEELKYQLLLSRDLRYLSDNDYETLIGLADEVGKLLFGWIKSQRVQSQT